MQIEGFFTDDEIRKDRDPLFLTCHPLGKIKMIATLISNESCMKDSSPFESFRSGDVYAMGEIIGDAVEEIEFLVEATQAQLIDLENRVRELEVGR